jgi:hypothetical protein
LEPDEDELDEPDEPPDVVLLSADVDALLSPELAAGVDALPLPSFDDFLA